MTRIPDGVVVHFWYAVLTIGLFCYMYFRFLCRNTIRNSLILALIFTTVVLLGPFVAKAEPASNPLAEWPNDADKFKSANLVCCDQQGHFYEKKFESLFAEDGRYSADMKVWIRQEYCFIKDSGSSTYESCLSHFTFSGNLDNKSMYR